MLADEHTLTRDSQEVRELRGVEAKALKNWSPAVAPERPFILTLEQLPVGDDPFTEVLVGNE